MAADICLWVLILYALYNKNNQILPGLLLSKKVVLIKVKAIIMELYLPYIG